MHRLQTLFAALVVVSSSLVRAEPLPVRVGQPLPQARKALLAAGWQPRPTTLAFPDESLQKELTEPSLLIEAGFVEVEYCSGTGANYCFFNYIKKGQCLRLVTAGESSPPDHRWASVHHVLRECPSPEAIGEGASQPVGAP
ncbi:MAG: hypothetical protein JO142_20795 [Burkholderiales bacterium]|nr:hypothetical protein [Burkholderiales bacterium]